ncbi:hypothetical protein [Orenia marismortui]|uniref:hypothetical protein n=1 Tax=Orenia marismortui TaxID=46469 RepID=UPI0003643CB3|nr:hypothetical protein [Orenia marismortui]
MKRYNNLLLMLLIIFLLFILCGANYKELGYTHEVYYNQQEGVFYLKRVGIDEKGVRYLPYFGDGDKKEIKELEQGYTESYHNSQQLVYERSVKRFEVFLLIVGLIILVILFFICRFVWRLFNKSESEW